MKILLNRLSLTTVFVAVFIALYILGFFLSPSDFSSFNRMFLLFGLSAVLLFFGFIKLGQKKQVSYLKSPLNLAVGLLVLSYILSTVTTSDKAGALLSPTG
ncbi:MAG: hypothetical protein M1120_03270, partial [Patescibacteria group bacterium]|nr:hypothetical protein [Patescibacteria group bacterium]